MRADLTAVLAGVTLLACVVLVVAYLAHRREVKVDLAHAVAAAKLRHPSSLPVSDFDAWERECAKRDAP